jgi:2-dehydropantoate 2-reductase
MVETRSDRPRVAVIGAGAMGAIFGAALSAAAEVWLIDPWAAHVAAIRRDGLQLEGPDGAVRAVPLSAVTDPAEAPGGADLALIFTKSAATRRAAETARQLLSADGAALTLQNGLGNAEVLADVIGPARTLAGVTAHGGTVLGPGRVRHAGEGETHIAGVGDGAASGPGRADPEAVADLLRRAGIPTSVTDDLDGLIWGKLLVNVGINALAALLRVPNGVLAEVPACDALMALAVGEAVAVVRARGIALPYDDPLERVRAVCRATAENRASMFQDVAAGRMTEVDVINGAIVRQGAEAGIPTPVNRMLTDLIHAVEATSEYRAG